MCMQHLYRVDGPEPMRLLHVRLLGSSISVVLFDRTFPKSQHSVSVVFILASYYALSVIYLMPVMNHGWVRRPPHGSNKYLYFCF